MYASRRFAGFTRHIGVELATATRRPRPRAVSCPTPYPAEQSKPVTLQCVLWALTMKLRARSLSDTDSNRLSAPIPKLSSYTYFTATYIDPPRLVRCVQGDVQSTFFKSADVSAAIPRLSAYGLPARDSTRPRPFRTPPPCRPAFGEPRRRNDGKYAPAPDRDANSVANPFT